MRYDLIVIGGGPAGMMAAGRAAEKGASVLLLEKNPRPGSKLLITGKGRCNITNSQNDLRDFTDKFGKNGKFLFSSMHKFGSSDVVEFFENRGLKLKTERGGRVFPETDNAIDILDLLLKYLSEGGVDVRTNVAVKKILVSENKIENIELLNGDRLQAKKYLLTTGGLSYPGTGSTGDGYAWAKELGHSIIETRPALTPILVKEHFVSSLEGLSLKNVEISIFKNNKRIDSRFGEAIFTAEGMSGPIILDMSKKVVEELNDDLKLRIDFKPALDFSELDIRMQNDFKENSNKDFKNSLDRLLPKKMIEVVIQSSGISPEKKVNLVTKEERKRLCHVLKGFELSIKGVVGYKKAIVTSGGVDLKEVDPKNMNSKIINNMYFAGEILDLDGPTGGYNLQVCWSTGFAVGNNI